MFLLASGSHDPADVLMVDDAVFQRPATDIGQLAHGFSWTEGRGGLGWALNAEPSLKKGSSVGIPSQPAILLPDGKIIKRDIRDAERMQGFDEDPFTTIAEGLELLHQRCSIFTDRVVAEALLDAIGWVQERDLADLRLLEPARGDGALLVPAARGLFRLARAWGRQNDEARLADCLVAYEIDSAKSRQPANRSQER